MSDTYLITDLGYTYVGIVHNKGTQIYSVVMDVEMVDIYTFLPWPCQMLSGKYDTHVASRSFICLKNMINNFIRYYVLPIVALVFKFFQIKIMP